MNVSPSIFREYDIRGIAGEEFSEKSLAEYEKWYGKFPGITINREVAKALGKAYGSIIRKRDGKKIVIGHEIRPFGEELKNQFIEGVLSTGCDVDDAGISLTPVIYFSTAFFGYDGGVNVTGSHNVYFFNGFKMMAKDVYPIFGEEIKEMKQRVERENYIVDVPGKRESKNVFEDYKKYLLEHNKVNKKLKVVLDCGNGSAGAFAPGIFKELGVELVELYTEPDSTFPNHVPDPEDVHGMEDLKKKVLEVGADVGIGLDADGDRCGMVDEKGQFIYADRVLLWLAQDMLSRNPGKKVLFDVKCTQLLEKLIPEFGGTPVMHKTGHAPIKQTIREDHEIMLGGEVSGHFYICEEYFRIDDGVFSSAKILSLLASQNKTVSEIFSQFPHTVMTPEIKLPCEDEVKHKVVSDITKVFENKYKIRTIDGARVQFSDTSWGLVRASNTSPYLTVRFEAETEEELLRIKNLMADELEEYEEIHDKLNRSEVSTHTGRLGWV